MGTVRVSVSYGITRPGEQPYSSENFRIGFDIEDDMTEDRAKLLATQLAQDTKLAVINEARLSSGVDENGVVFPVFAGGTPAPAVTENVATVTSITDAPSAAPAPAPVQTQQRQGGGSGKDLTWDGRPAHVFDNRAKKASGEYKSNAADFKVKFLDVGDEAPDSVKFKSIWLKNKNDSVNQAGLTLAAMYDAT